MKCHLLLSLSLALFASACTSSTSSGPAGFGTLVGQVQVFNYHDQPLSDGSGVTVSADSTGVHTLTRADGSYTLEQVPAGTHVLYFTKPGFGTMKYFNIGVPGPGTIYIGTYPIGEIPPIAVRLDSMVQSTQYIDLFDLYYTTDDTIWGPRTDLSAEIRRVPFHSGDSVWHIGCGNGVQVGSKSHLFASQALSLHFLNPTRGDSVDVILRPTSGHSYYDPRIPGSVDATLGKPSNTYRVVVK